MAAGFNLNDFVTEIEDFDQEKADLNVEENSFETHEYSENNGKGD